MKLDLKLELPVVEKLTGYVGKVIERNHVGGLLKLANTYVANRAASRVQKIDVDRGH